jgi:hypothetical protein
MVQTNSRRGNKLFQKLLLPPHIPQIFFDARVTFILGSLQEEKAFSNRQKSQENKAQNWEAVKAESERDQAALEAAQVHLEQASRGNMAGDEVSLRSQLDGKLRTGKSTIHSFVR